ncbi:MAG: hypothetical protein WD598_05325 [Acidimicrobiia bacterium]
MANDVNETLRAAAASPTRDAPLSLIEARLRRRRHVRRGAAGVCALALIAALGGGVALSVDSGPRIETVTPAASPGVSAGDPPVSVDLPDGWVESPIEPGMRFDGEILAVGTTLQPAGVPHSACFEDEMYNDDVVVVLRETTHVTVLEKELAATQRLTTEAYGQYPLRPDNFATAESAVSTCLAIGTDVPWEIHRYTFSDQGRVFIADVGFGPTSTPEARAEAFAVLNSLVVEPWLEEPPVPVTTVPPSTVPASADTQAIEAAFETWVAAGPPDFDGAEAVIEDFASIKATAQEAADLVGNPQCYTGRVDAITRIDEDDADVIFSFFCDGLPAVPTNQPGRAVKIDGVWMVSRDTVCATFAIGQARCPPRE